MSDDYQDPGEIPQPLETIDPNNPPPGYDGPKPLETIDPNNPPPGYDGPKPLETIDPNNPPPGYDGPLPIDPSQVPTDPGSGDSGTSGPGDFPYDPNDPNRYA